MRVYKIFLIFISSTVLALLSNDHARSMEDQEAANNKSRLAQVVVAVESKRSLNFLDHDQPTDELNFLSTTFPEDVEESNRRPAIKSSSPSITKNECLDIMKEVVFSETYSPVLLGSKKEAQNIRIIELQELAKYYKSRLAQTNFENLFYKEKNKSNIIILEDVALAAHHIDDVLIREGNAPVLFLGRTPCFIQVAYEELCKRKYPELSLEEHSIQLSFSGTPDVLNSRQASNDQNIKSKIISNMVTPDKLDFYENYLTQKGMNNISKKLYIVDMMGTGGSLNSFLRLLRHYYQIHLKQDMPDIHFLCLSLTQGSDHRSPLGTWVFNHKSQMLTFSSDLEHGIRSLEIRTTPLQLSCTTIKDFLDHDLAQQYATHGIEFPAHFWRGEFTRKLTQGGFWHKEVYALLRPMLKELVNNHEDQLGRKQPNYTGEKEKVPHKLSKNQKRKLQRKGN